MWFTKPLSIISRPRPASIFVTLHLLLLNDAFYTFFDAFLYTLIFKMVYFVTLHLLLLNDAFYTFWVGTQNLNDAFLYTLIF